MVTRSASEAPASASVFSMLRKVCGNCASKSPASDLPESSTCPVCPAIQRMRPAPSVMTTGENARLTCQVPRTNDFFMGATLLSLHAQRAQDLTRHPEALALLGEPR